MRRIVVGIAGLCSVVGISPASAQTYVPWWSPEAVEVAESRETVVLTLAKGGPGQVRYRTEDGACADNRIGGPPPSDGCYGARAPGDYQAVSGQVVFTEAGSKKIRIPIVDDRLNEGSEAFTVIATEVDERGGWVAGTTTGTVHIIDDDGVSDSAGEPAPASKSTTTIQRPSPASSPIATVPPVGAPVLNAPPTPTTSTASDLNELASGELRPGPELTMDEGPWPAPDRPDGNDRSAFSLALGLGTAAAVFGGGVVWMRQRGRSSPTRR